MAWSETEISQFQIDNNKALAEVNATLRPDAQYSSNIGIFLPGQAGDLATAMSVLKYRNEFFPQRNIVWFVNSPNVDLLRYAPIHEVRPWPWPGNGLPIDAGGDYFPLLTTFDNRLIQSLKEHYEDVADIGEGWFPAPWMLSPEKRHGLQYPNVSKMIFGVPEMYPWHPLLSWSEQEKLMADIFMSKISGKKVYVETFAGSGQSRLNEEMIVDAMNLCREHWDGCSFIFGSHKYLRGNEQFPENFFQQENVYSSAEFTVRQSALITSKCDLMISVSSGLTVAASAHGINQPPTIQYCGSEICSTKALAHTNFQLVTADDKRFEDSKIQFYTALINLLNRYK